MLIYDCRTRVTEIQVLKRIRIADTNHGCNWSSAMIKANRFLEYWQGLFGGLREQERSLSQMSRGCVVIERIFPSLDFLCTYYLILH